MIAAIGSLALFVAAVQVLKTFEHGSGPVDLSGVQVAAPDLGVDVPDVSLPDVPDVDVPGIDTYDDGEGYEFIARNLDGSPVRYNPCETISYVVHPGGGPPDAVAFVDRAVTNVEAATGLDFVFEGTTDEIPSNLSLGLQGFVGGDADVWVGWADVDESDLLPNDHSAAGVGGSMFEEAPRLINRGSFTSGFAILDEDSGASNDFGPGFSQGNVLLHELGHVVGLDHVDDASQIMYPDSGEPIRGYQAGDLEGLRRLGEGGCL